MADYTQLGSTDLKVPPVCLGTLTFGSDSDFETSRLLVETCLNNGINFFDTADSYNAGISEEFLGEILKGKRSKVTIASKVGMIVRKGSYSVDLSKNHIFKSIDESLIRLKTDYIDLYQVHWPDNTTNQEETLQALNTIHQAGKVRYIGCSNYSGWQFIQALWISSQMKLVPFSTIQPRYNLLDRHAEDEIIPAALDQSLAIIPYNPIAGGLLAGSYSFATKPPPGTRFGDQEQYRHRYWYPQNFQAVDDFQKIATELGYPMAALAIAWIMNQESKPRPIFGVENTDQLGGILHLLRHPISKTITSRLDMIQGIAYDRFAPWRKDEHKHGN